VEGYSVAGVCVELLERLSFIGGWGGRLLGPLLSVLSESIPSCQRLWASTHPIATQIKRHINSAFIHFANNINKYHRFVLSFFYIISFCLVNLVKEGTIYQN
jgi:hypothetical protein